MKSGSQPTTFSYSMTLRHNALVKRIQRFTEQSTPFKLGETLDSFEHFLYFTLWRSRVFDGNENVGRAIEKLFCLRFSFDARGSNSGPVSTEATFPLTKTKHSQIYVFLFSPVSTDVGIQDISRYFTLK